MYIIIIDSEVTPGVVLFAYQKPALVQFDAELKTTKLDFFFTSQNFPLLLIPQFLNSGRLLDYTV